MLPFKVVWGHERLFAIRLLTIATLYGNLIPSNLLFTLTYSMYNCGLKDYAVSSLIEN